MFRNIDFYFPDGRVISCNESPTGLPTTHNIATLRSSAFLHFKSPHDPHRGFISAPNCAASLVAAGCVLLVAVQYIVEMGVQFTMYEMVSLPKEEEEEEMDVEDAVYSNSSKRLRL